MEYLSIILFLAYASIPPAQSLRLGGSSETVKIQYHPYHAVILWNNTFRCTGAIVSRIFVMTVENCVPHELTSVLSRLQIRVGVTNRNDKKEGTLHSVSGCYAAHHHTHDDFYMKHLVNYPSFKDIVIVRVSQPFTYSSSIKPVVINSKYSELHEGMYVLVSGWGPEPTKYCDSSLRHTIARFIKHSDCKVKGLKNHEICTDYDNLAEEDSYESDVGDLMQGELIGIVTNERCCQKTLEPVIYTNVSAFYHSNGRGFIEDSNVEANRYYHYTPEVNNDVWEAPQLATHSYRKDSGSDIDNNVWPEHL